jgi:hypothetical protein
MDNEQKACYKILDEVRMRLSKCTTSEAGFALLAEEKAHIRCLTLAACLPHKDWPAEVDEQLTLMQYNPLQWGALYKPLSVSVEIHGPFDVKRLMKGRVLGLPDTWATPNATHNIY